MIRTFHVKPVKPDREGLDWKVSTSQKTMDYIAVKRTNDDPEYQDRLPAYFASESDAVFRARELAQTYAPAQVVHHYKPTVPREGRGW
jgi:hypothetical protein